MIPIKKSIRNAPKSLSSKECNDSLNQVIDTTDEEHKEKIKPVFYRANDVLSKLKNLYHSKCAYCETYEPEPEIEHYRPKKQINGVKREIHKGYYWLSYEWTNLLPACHDCNKNGVKGNHFPIEGTRRYTFKTKDDGTIDLSGNELLSDYLQGEKPLLLNPETPNFDPFIYFEFNNVGRLISKPIKTAFEFRQATQTIQILQLNRDKLFIKRKKEIRTIFQSWLKGYYLKLLTKEISANYFKKQVLKILNNIIEQSKPNKEYSFFWSYLYQYFEFFIRKYFKKRKQRQIFIQIYKKHQITKFL